MRVAALTEENLQELAETAEELRKTETETNVQLPEFARPEVRQRVLRVLQSDTLRRWLSDVFRDSAQRQPQVEVALQRAGFMSVADVLESALTDADLKQIGFKQMGTRKKLLHGAQGLVTAGERRGIFITDTDISPTERAERAVIVEQLLDVHGQLHGDTQLGAPADAHSPTPRGSNAAPGPTLTTSDSVA